MSKISWGTFMPLIGGFPIGCEKATKTLPSYILGYNISSYNDGLYVRYMNENRKLNIPYRIVDNPEFDATALPYVDIINVTPFCSGLSMLNSSVGKGSKSRGSDAEQNKWIYDSLELSLKLKPKVVIGENAPGLFTSIGDGVRTKIYEIAKSHGYSVSFVKTTTSLHGLPQRRDRTFYFVWNNKKAPILEYIKRDNPGYFNYLSKFSGELDKEDLAYRTEFVESDWLFRYVTDDLSKTYKELQEETEVSLMEYINTLEKVDEYIKFLTKSGAREDLIKTKEKRPIDNALRKAIHCKNKISKGLGVWDYTLKPVHPDANISALINKNAHLFLHPTEVRTLTLREQAYLMGLPTDFYVDDLKSQTIGQNVPVNTAVDMIQHCIDFINGNVTLSNTDYVMQSNITRQMQKVNKLEEPLF